VKGMKSETSTRHAERSPTALKLRLLTHLLAAVGIVLLHRTPARAVTDEEVFRDFRFNFINPGARSLGLGGAFISIADDATAAQANPAGMANLTSPQLFMELRYSVPDTTTTEVSFRFPFSPTDGYDVEAETDPDSTLTPSFLSYVMPFKGERLYLGFSRQEALESRNRTFNLYEVEQAGASDRRVSEGDIDASLVNWNVSLGWRVVDNLRLGATVSYGRLDMTSHVVNTYTDPTGTIIGDPALAGVPFEMYRTTTDGADSDITFAVGLLWQVIPRVRIGASFHDGGRYKVDQTLVAHFIDPALVPGQIASQVFFNETNTLLAPGGGTATLPLTFNVPKVYGIGVSWLPINPMTLSLDAERVTYSDLMEGFNSRLNLLTVFFTSDEEAAFTIEDATNLLFGGEYRFGEQTRVSLRAGWHQDHSSRLQSDFAPGGIGLASNENFPGRGNVDHYSAGVGITFKNQLMLDLAVDWSSLGTEAVSSLTYRF